MSELKTKSNRERFSNSSTQRYSPHRQSPTLAELNIDYPVAKRPAFSAAYSPPPHSLSSTTPFFTAISDSPSPSMPLPRGIFNDKEGLDELSSSFRSLYKSIFGQLGGNEYLNEYTTLSDLHTNPGHELASSDSSMSSVPLGASASLLQNQSKCTHPQFLSLMDNFREMADSRSWDKLDPAHVQGLLESFKEGQSDKFGLDVVTYADVHASFNQFLSQLNNRFLAGSLANMPPLVDYNHDDGAHQQHPGLLEQQAKYQQYRLDSGEVSAIPLVGMSQVSPTDGYPVSDHTPSQHINLMNQSHLQPVGGTNHTHLNSRYGQYTVPTGNTATLNSLAQDTESTHIKPTVTELFDDDDDFDWSKLM